MKKNLSVEAELHIQEERMSTIAKLLEKTGWQKIKNCQRPLNYPECVQFHKGGRGIFISPRKKDSTYVEIWETKILCRINTIAKPEEYMVTNI